MSFGKTNDTWAKNKTAPKRAAFYQPTKKLVFDLARIDPQKGVQRAKAHKACQDKYCRQGQQHICQRSRDHIEVVQCHYCKCQDNPNRAVRTAHVFFHDLQFMVLPYKVPKLGQIFSPLFDYQNITANVGIHPKAIGNIECANARETSSME